MATADDYAAWIVKNQDKKGTPEFDTVAQAYQLAKKKPATVDPLQDKSWAATEMSGPEKFMAGVGKAVYDTGRGLGQLTGLVSADDVKESRERDAPLMDTGAGMAGNVVGNIGMALAPGGVVKGAGSLAGMAGATNAATKLNAVGGALMAPKSVGGALGVGAAQGLIQPAADMGERVFNTGLGAGASAAIPVAGKVLSTAKAAAEPFYESGRNQILARALRESAGGGKYADDALASLKGAGELVLGSAPTAGQAANNAGIAGLERSAVAVNPAVAVEHTNRLAAQNTARVNALKDMAGSDGARDFARAELQSTADDLYKVAFEKGTDLRRDAATGKFLTKAQQAGVKGEITKLMNAPAMAEAVEKAKVLAANEMKKVDDPAGSVLGLHYTKKALDDMIGGAKGNEQRILIGLRDRLLTTVDRLSPDYAAARSVFKDMAKPVNQMDTAAEIAKRAIPANENMTLNSYARALKDDSAATAQGFRKATLEGTFEPEQLARLNAIKEDLRRAQFAKDAGRGPGSDTVQKLAYSNIMNQAGVPNMLRNLAPGQLVGNLLSRGGDLAYQKANQRLSEKLAGALLDPKETAALMAMKPNERAALIGEMLKRGGASLGMTAPALLNAQQQ